jgi:hypothetical protein
MSTVVSRGSVLIPLTDRTERLGSEGRVNRTPRALFWRHVKGENHGIEMNRKVLFPTNTSRAKTVKSKYLGKIQIVRSSLIDPITGRIF